MFNIIPLIKQRMMFTPSARTHGKIFYGRDGYDSNLRETLSGDIVADIESRVKNIVETETSEAIYKYLGREFNLSRVEADLREFEFFTWIEENNGAIESWTIDPSFNSGRNFNLYHLKFHVRIGIKRNYVYNEQDRVLQPNGGIFTSWGLRGMVR